MSQIFAFGDSITWGCWDIEGGWTDRLKKEIVKEIDEGDEEKEIIFYNLGIPSGRTDQLLTRFQNEVDARFDEDNQERYFIFAFGANDSAYQIDRKKFRLDTEEYKSNIEKVIEQAKKYSSNIVFLSTTPVDEAQTDGVLNPTKSRKNEYVDLYNQVLLRVCKEKDVDLIDINSEFKKIGATSLLYEDGLHPNTNGHNLILRLVKNYFMKKKVL